MSKRVEKGIICPKCNNNVIVNIWGSINISSDPSLIVKVKDGTLFAWQCPECGYKVKLIYPCLYYDLNNKFMIYLIPLITNNNLEQLIINREFQEFRGFNKRIVNSLEDLQEKINIFEHGLLDNAIELTKLAFNKVLEDKNDCVVLKSYFSFSNKVSKNVHFRFILSNKQGELHKFTKYEVYNKALDILRIISPKYDEVRFIKINNSWAKQAFEQYKSIDNNK